MVRIGKDQRRDDLIDFAVHALLRKRITRIALDEPLHERFAFIGRLGVESDGMAYVLNGDTGYGAPVMEAIACEVHPCTFSFFAPTMAHEYSRWISEKNPSSARGCETICFFGSDESCYCLCYRRDSRGEVLIIRRSATGRDVMAGGRRGEEAGGRVRGDGGA